MQFNLISNSNAHLRVQARAHTHIYTTYTHERAHAHSHQEPMKALASSACLGCGKRIFSNSTVEAAHAGLLALAVALGFNLLAAHASTCTHTHLCEGIQVATPHRLGDLKVGLQRLCQAWHSKLSALRHLTHEQPHLHAGRQHQHFARSVCPGLMCWRHAALKKGTLGKA